MYSFTHVRWFTKCHIKRNSFVIRDWLLSDTKVRHQRNCSRNLLLLLLKLEVANSKLSAARTKYNDNKLALFAQAYIYKKVLQTSMKIVMKVSMLTVILFSFVLEFRSCVNTVKFFIFY